MMYWYWYFGIGLLLAVSAVIKELAGYYLADNDTKLILELRGSHHIVTYISLFIMILLLWPISIINRIF